MHSPTRSHRAYAWCLWQRACLWRHAHIACLHLQIPFDLPRQFLELAKPNTARNVETCGILTGQLKAGAFHITHVSSNHVTRCARAVTCGCEWLKALCDGFLGFVYTPLSGFCLCLLCSLSGVCSCLVYSPLYCLFVSSSVPMCLAFAFVFVSLLLSVGFHGLCVRACWL